MLFLLLSVLDTLLSVTPHTSSTIRLSARILDGHAKVRAGRTESCLIFHSTHAE